MGAVTGTAGPSDEQKLRALPWFLGAEALNTFFYLWTFGGSLFVLLLTELGLPKAQIGLLLALFPFSGTLALGFAPVAARLGWKRVFLVGYGGRKLAMALLLLLPWVLSHVGRTAGLTLLFGAVTTVAILRALAETGYYPWQQEFIPNDVRGKFTGLRFVVGTTAAALALLVAGQVLGPRAGLDRYLGLLAAGCVLGFMGVVLMARVPGGAPRREVEVNGAHRAQMAYALRDRNFLAYLSGAGAVALGTMLFVSFLPLYVKEQFGVPPGTVVTLDAAAMVGGALSSLVMGRAADRFGSRPVLMPAVAMATGIPLGWLLLPRHLAHPVVWCAGLYFTYGVAVNGAAVASIRLLFNGVIPRERSTAYTAIYYAWIGIAGGVAPLLAGFLLSASDSAHALLFILATVLLAAGCAMYGQVKPDGAFTTRGAMHHVVARATRRRSRDEG